jgi:Xaa-Pro aminopeptidase
MTRGKSPVPPPEVYRRRRAALAARLTRPLVVFAGHPPARNYAANHFPFRPGSCYTYFGGLAIEHAALWIEPGSDGQAGTLLLRRPRTLDDDVWLGPGIADSTVAEHAGLPVSAVRDVEQLSKLAAGRSGGAAFVATPAVETLALAGELGLSAPSETEMLAIIDLRLCKDEHELAAMRFAADISMQAHRAALAVARPGASEADVAAEYLGCLVANLARPSFNPIVTIHGDILHTLEYAAELEPGRLLLVDAGAEEPGGYACDITRVTPIGGTWTPIQRHLYDTVHRANLAAVAACVAGARFRDVHDLSCRVICEGLVQAELLRGDPAALAERRAHALFFVHGLGHLIGLDVHDMEEFGDLAGYSRGRSRRPGFGDRNLRMDRDLAPGMCLTIEPGIYLNAAVWRDEALTAPFRDVIVRPKIDALLQQPFGGIRLEHTICVRADGGPEVLTDALPMDADGVVSITNA